MNATTLELAIDFFTGRHAFAVDATLAGVVVGAMCGLVGSFLVLQRMSLIGDAAGHATLPGVAGAYLLTGSKSLVVLLCGAMGSALLAVGAVALFERGRRARPDAVLALVLSVSFGVGVVLLSYAQHHASGTQAGLNTFLYGSAAAISRSQLLGITASAVAAGAAVLISYRALALATFDERFARTAGVPVTGLRVALLFALCLAVVVSVQAVGVVLVAAMLIIPPSAGRLLSRRLDQMVVVSTALGALSGLTGALASYLVPGLATGPAMVLVAAALFGASLLSSALRGRR